NVPAEVINLMQYINMMEDRTSWKISGHPKNRDLVLEIKVWCKQKGPDLFLSGDVPLKIGLQFSFSTALYSITGTIIGMKRK
ncbi:unnamed protein product, partial [marine sediment metagenome]